jgi:hypothetical protein
VQREPLVWVVNYSALYSKQGIKARC